MKYILPFFSLFILTILFNCSTQKEALNVSSGVLPELTSEVKFELDTSDDANSRSVQLYSNNNKFFLIYHHTSTNKIVVYDLASKRIVSNIRFDKEGSNGVGEGITSMYFHNFDSIFLLSSLAQKIYLADSARNVKAKIDVSNNFGYVDFGTMSPPFIKNGEIFLRTYPNPMKKSSSTDVAMIKIDLKTKAVEKVIYLSKEYDRGWWGRHLYLLSSVTYNKTQDLLVTSYPNDNYLYTMDFRNNIQKHIVKADKISQLNPVSDNVINDDNKMLKHATEQGYYAGIMFDEWRKIYYRISYAPQAYNSQDDLGKGLTLIVIDENFNKLGELDFHDSKYAIGSSFIAPSGLFLFNKEKYNLDDNFLSYDVFEFKRQQLDNSTTEKNIIEYLTKMNADDKKQSLKDGTFIIIPASGCISCFNEAVKFLKLNIDSTAFRFIITEVTDKKFLKNRIGYKVYHHNSLRLDLLNLWRKYNISGDYPLIVSIKNQSVTNYFYADPSHKESWNKLR
jgi:hypothetical protein